MSGPRVLDYVRSMSPYVPGKPIEETQREYGLERVVKLASNENPLGPSPKAMEAVRTALSETHRYPDSSGYRIKRKIAAKVGADPAQIVVGNGSDDVIDMIICAFCELGDAIVTSKAGFVAYRVRASAHGVRALESPLRPGYRFDLDAMLDLLKGDDRAKLVFIANPNNPTGVYVPENELRSFLGEVSKIRGGSVGVVLDYAYWEYVTAKDLPDPMRLQREFPNVIVLRTFSKIYGLAGLRVGYGVARPEYVESMDKLRTPFNVNSLALAGAEAALDDDAFVQGSRDVNAEGMAFWERKLEALGIPFVRSQGNFLLADVTARYGMPAEQVYAECLKRGVIFRPVRNYGLMNELRISVGLPEENEFAVEVLRAIRR